MQAQSRFDGLLESVRGDQLKIGSLEEGLQRVRGEKRALEERAGQMEEEVKRLCESQRQGDGERQALQQRRSTLDQERAMLEALLATQKAERDAGRERELNLEKELQHLVEVGTIPVQPHFIFTSQKSAPGPNILHLLGQIFALPQKRSQKGVQRIPYTAFSPLTSL